MGDIKKYSQLLPTNPLCGISTYKDTLNLATGACTRYIYKVVFNGSEGWRYGTYPYIDDFLSYGNDYLRQKINISMCSHLPTSANIASGESVVPDTCCFLTEGYRGVFYYKDTSFSDLTSFKTWISAQYTAGTPLTLWYILATPTTETITVPTGESGIVEGFLTQSGTPSANNPIYPIANDLTGWYHSLQKFDGAAWQNATVHEF